MKCLIKFSLDNAAFHWKGYSTPKENRETLDVVEIGRVIQDIGKKIANGHPLIDTIHDANGNRVGEYKIYGR